MKSAFNALAAIALFAGGALSGAYFQTPGREPAGTEKMISADGPAVEPVLNSSGQAELTSTWGSSLAFKPSYVAYGLGLLFLLIHISRRRRVVPISMFAGGRAVNPTEASLARTAAHMNQKMSDPPRELIRNPYGAEFEGLDFDTRVQAAIEASLRASRVIGVIHLAFAGTENLPPGQSEARLQAMADAFRQKMRPSDAARVTGANEISIFISLLPDRDRLQSIARRLYLVAKETEAATQLRISCQPGLAMYPIDGYSAGDLIASARENAVTCKVTGGPGEGWSGVHELTLEKT